MMLVTEEKNWQPILPVPDDAPEPTFWHNKLGTPERNFTYATADGKLWGFVCRFTGADGKKEIRPRHFGQFNGNPQWAWMGHRSLNCPLFNLRSIVRYPERPVLFVEGEKTVEKAEKIFSEFSVVTSFGGSKSPNKSDFTTLLGKTVYIWPDNDPAGQNYGMTVARLCASAKVQDIKIVEIPDKFPPKWDLADPFPDGVQRETLLDLLNAAKSVSSPKAIKADNGVIYPFRLTEKEVQFEKNSEEDIGTWIPICSRLEVVAFSRNEKGEDWGRYLKLIDPDGNEHHWAMPMSMLAGDGTACREILLSLGLRIEPGRGNKELSHKYISSCQPRANLTCVNRIGWHNRSLCFVLPDHNFGDNNYVLQSTSPLENNFRTSGCIGDWQKNIGIYAIGNSRLIMAINAAFAAPLLHVLGIESGGFHFRGLSSIGKTTALRVAGSVWGGGGLNGYIQSWRATTNGLEGIAATHSDALLCLDEIGQAPPTQVGEAAYMLANGTGKNRANRSGHCRSKLEWRSLFLSNGEVSLTDRLNEIGRSSTAGQEVRIVDIPADTQTGNGLFENLHSFTSSHKFAEHLNMNSRIYYGSPIRTFIQKLVECGVDSLSNEMDKGISSFVESLDLEGTSGQVHRVARRFGLLAVAGEFAARKQVVPWDTGEATWGAKQCFSSWLTERDGDGPREIQDFLKSVRYFFELHGDSRFAIRQENYQSQFSNGHPKAIINRAGFKDQSGDFTDYYVLPEVFRNEMCTKFKPIEAAKILVKHGLLQRGTDSRNSKKMRLPGMGPTRCYHFKTTTLSEVVDEAT